MWPANLAELTPEYLPAVPLDRYDGQPLRYRVVAGRPLIYSVGADRHDDGGRLPDVPELRANTPNRAARLNALARDGNGVGNAPGPVNGDWVLWPRPVTPPVTRVPAQ